MSKENNISKRTGMSEDVIPVGIEGGKEDLSDLKWIENRNKKELSEARIAQLLKKADKYPEQLTREEIKQLTYIKQQFDGMLANHLESKDLTEEDKKKVNEYLEKVK